jgi:hypothetical protein
MRFSDHRSELDKLIDAQLDDRIVQIDLYATSLRGN